MTAEQKQMEMLKAILKMPCAICDERPVIPKRFVPADPFAFGIATGEAIYFPVYRRCFDAGIDYDFLEATLLRCGWKHEND